MFSFTTDKKCEMASLTLEDETYRLSLLFVHLTTLQPLQYFLGYLFAGCLGQAIILVLFNGNVFIHHADDSAVNNRLPELFDQVKN